MLCLFLPGCCNRGMLEVGWLDGVGTAWFVLVLGRVGFQHLFFPQSELHVPLGLLKRLLEHCRLHVASKHEISHSWVISSWKWLEPTSSFWQKCADGSDNTEFAPSSSDLQKSRSRAEKHPFNPNWAVKWNWSITKRKCCVVTDWLKVLGTKSVAVASNILGTQRQSRPMMPLRVRPQVSICCATLKPRPPLSCDRIEPDLNCHQGLAEPLTRPDVTNQLSSHASIAAPRGKAVWQSLYMERGIWRQPPPELRQQPRLFRIFRAPCRNHSCTAGIWNIWAGCLPIRSNSSHSGCNSKPKIILARVPIQYQAAIFSVGIQTSGCVFSFSRKGVPFLGLPGNSLKWSDIWHTSQTNYNDTLRVTGAHTTWLSAASNWHAKKLHVARHRLWKALQTSLSALGWILRTRLHDMGRKGL